MKPIKIENFKVKVSPEDIIRALGLTKKKTKKKAELEKIIREEEPEIEQLIHARGIYKIIDWQETNCHPIFDRAKKVALAICTIGSELEKKSSELMKKNQILQGLILDAYGSEAVEQVACRLDQIIAEEAKKLDLWPSRRFSPGYGQWDIQEQAFLFKILPAEEIGVRLKESFMMEPRKSISFRINFYSTPDPLAGKSMCLKCKMKNCPYRKPRVLK
ncbi:MAG: vitamin B12 dependent-methionine synthase activation domain-containing protein [Candidatus Aminicenantia bacterium]